MNQLVNHFGQGVRFDVGSVEVVKDEKLRYVCMNMTVVAMRNGGVVVEVSGCLREIYG